LARYEALRRAQFEALTGLVETLGQVDGLPTEQLDQARDALFHADHPFLIVLIGAFNAGKSSLINALLGEAVLGVGPTPTTDRIVVIRQGATTQRLITGVSDTIFHPAPLLERASLVDTPGLDSVMLEHDATTRAFLHRADQVWLVMLATQAMSQQNVESMHALRDYGKRVVLIINQIDLLEADEQQTVREFVTSQAKAALGLEPDIWLISAKWALQAQIAPPPAPRDDALWQKSGFAAIERYLQETLSDAARVRQKIETPLQIARRVTAAAQHQIRDQQNALAPYAASAQTVRAQIDRARGEQESNVRTTINQIDAAFATTEARGRSAIRDTFALTHATRLVGSALAEVTGLAALSRRFGARTATRTAFDTAQVNAPLDHLPATIEALGPTLEGRDLQDIDDLIAYARREIDKLPPAIRSHQVGILQPPASYDRASLPAVRAPIEAALQRAQSVELDRLDRAVRGALVVLAFYEIVVLIIGVVFGIAASGSATGSNLVLLVLGTILLLLAGLFVLPIRGLIMARAYADRLAAVNRTINDQLQAGAAQQIAVGVRLRQDAVTPFLRLVETQTVQTDQLNKTLIGHAQTLDKLEKELAALVDYT